MEIIKTTNKKIYSKAQRKEKVLMEKQRVEKLSRKLRRHKEKNTYIAARTSKLRRSTAEKILEEIKTQFKLGSREESLAVIAILF